MVHGAVGPKGSRVQFFSPPQAVTSAAQFLDCDEIIIVLLLLLRRKAGVISV